MPCPRTRRTHRLLRSARVVSHASNSLSSFDIDGVRPRVGVQQYCVVLTCRLTFFCRLHSPAGLGLQSSQRRCSLELVFIRRSRWMAKAVSVAARLSNFRKAVSHLPQHVLSWRMPEQLSSSWNQTVEIVGVAATLPVLLNSIAVNRQQR